MAFKDLTSKAKKSVSDFNDDRAKKKEAALALRVKEAEIEAEKKDRILQGDIKPIGVAVNLPSGEVAYVQLPTKRIANVETIIETTTGKSKKKHGITRAVVGGVLLGPIGAGVGAVTAASKNKSVTTQNKVNKISTVDTGHMILTNKRVIFVGNQVVSMPYSNIITSTMSGQEDNRKLTFKYEGMLNGEHYSVSGPASKYVDSYIKGIRAINSRSS